MEIYNKIYLFCQFLKQRLYHETEIYELTAFNVTSNWLQVIVMYIVINIIDNFLSRDYSRSYKYSKTEIAVSTYHLYNVTYLINVI